MGNRHRAASKDPDLGIVLGFGAGSPSRLTCMAWQKDLMLHSLNSYGIKSYEGRKGGPMSGWAKHNMNQYFRAHERDDDVDCMQLEVIYELRKDPSTAQITASYMAQAIQIMPNAMGFNGHANFNSY
jgi:hypothetical protein